MAIAHFASLDDAEVVDVRLLTWDGDWVDRRLLVDCGFTGESALVVGLDTVSLGQVAMSPSRTAGALSGEQVRIVLTCGVRGLPFRRPLIAIVADLTALQLPVGVEGLAGLQFLRQFDTWGAERAHDGWRFFLGIDR